MTQFRMQLSQSVPHRRRRYTLKQAGNADRRYLRQTIFNIGVDIQYLKEFAYEFERIALQTAAMLAP